MGYVIAAILVVLLVGGFVAYLVMNASRKSGAPAAGDEEPGIGGDSTALGDTVEHGSREGSDRFEREATPPYSGDPAATAERARPGEAEGAERVDPDEPRQDR